MTSAVVDRRLARVQALHLAGRTANDAGRPAQAIGPLRRAAALLPTPDEPGTDTPQWRSLGARVWLSLATSQFELSGTALARVSVDRAEALARGTEDLAVRALLHLQRGYLELHAGEVRTAIVELDAGVSLLPHADPDAQYSLLLTRSNGHLVRGDLRRARADLHAAIEVIAGRDQPAEELMARHNLGYVEYLAGNLAMSLEMMRDAAALDTQVSRAVILLDRSRVLIEAGLVREADDILDEAGRRFASERQWKSVGEVELARAHCALISGDPVAARQLAGTARDRFRRRRNDSWRRQAELVLLQADLAAGRPGLRLAPPAKRLAFEFQAQGLTTHARTAQLIAADALLQTRREDEAAQVVDGIVPRRTDPISVRLYEHFVRARLALSSHDRPAARRYVRRGLADLASYQSSFGSIDLQAGSAVHGRRLVQLDLEMALRDGRPAGLLDAVERGRATSNRLLPVQSPGDDESAELLAELRQTTESLRESESESEADAPDPEDLDRQRARVSELQRLLRARSWSADGSRRAGRAARAAQIVAALGEQDATLACYVQVGGALHVLSAGRAGMRVRDLGDAGEVYELVRRIRADLDVLAHGHVPRALIGAVRGGLRRSLAELDARLVAPLGLGDERVVVVPTGILAVLAWNCLPSLHGRPVVVAPSASSWLAASAPEDLVGAPGVAVFAGPGLARSHEEAAAVAGLWPGSHVSVGEQADQAALVDAMAHAGVVHVAAHGQHHAENPLFSSIRLADGPVFAYEFDQNARSAGHVILSACELGLATIRPGDEALGLTSVLLHLGTRSVISGVARVHDDVAAEVMFRYHSALVRGTDSAQALADACAAEPDAPTPFVCFGAAWRWRSNEPPAV